MSDVEKKYLVEAFDSNWIAPVGPDLDAFETELGRWTGRTHVTALASGTAALHLAMLVSGVEPGDDVIVSSFTFVASANAVLQSGAIPVFVDSSLADWNLDPDLLADTLEDRARRGKLPAAVVAVDSYGQCADYGRLEPICERWEIPLVADSAEALGSKRAGRLAGSHGSVAVLSFNGNKILTTGGGGALITNDSASSERCRYLATQARQPVPHYEHIEPGYNYRMPNLLAAVGRGQLERLPRIISRREEIQARYIDGLGDLDGLGFMPVPADSEPNRWLTVATVDAKESGTSTDVIRVALEAENIEARPTWKPMHQQPMFQHAEIVGGAVSDYLFQDGLCLPSGSSLTNEQLDRVIGVVRACFPSESK